MFSDNTDKKSNIFERSWTNFKQAEFVMDLFYKDLSNILNLKHSNVNALMESLVSNLNNLLGKHALLKKKSVNIS